MRDTVTRSTAVSAVKFCLRLFNLPPIGALDSVPGDMSDDIWSCFDFTQQPLDPQSPVPM